MDEVLTWASISRCLIRVMDFLKVSLSPGTKASSSSGRWQGRVTMNWAIWSFRLLRDCTAAKQTQKSRECQGKLLWMWKHTSNSHILFLIRALSLVRFCESDFLHELSCFCRPPLLDKRSITRLNPLHKPTFNPLYNPFFHEASPSNNVYSVCCCFH